MYPLSAVRRFQVTVLRVACSTGGLLALPDLPDLNAAVEPLGIRPRGSAGDAAVPLTPATHTILAQLKAGETVYQAGEPPKKFKVSNLKYTTNHLKQCVRHLLPRFSRL